MNNYESLLQEAHENGVHVYERYKFNSPNIKGLYCDGSVALNSGIAYTTEKACTLAEELGHYFTSTGNITDQSKVGNRSRNAEPDYTPTEDISH